MSVMPLNYKLRKVISMCSFDLTYRLLSVLIKLAVEIISQNWAHNKLNIKNFLYKYAFSVK